MSKKFNDIFDAMIDDYADYKIKLQRLGAVDTKHQLEQKRRELKNDLWNWFIEYVETLSDNKEKVLDDLFGVGGKS